MDKARSSDGTEIATTLDGQDHNVAWDVLAPELTEFLGS